MEIGEIREIREYKQKKIENITKLYKSYISNETSNYNKIVESVKRNVGLSQSQKKLELKEVEKTFNTSINYLKDKLKSGIEQITNIGNIKEKTKKKALLIGINYINTEYVLNGCINDVNLVKDYIQTKDFSEITLITDKSEIRPTRSNIISSLENFLLNAADEDFLYFHYSGHGSYVQDTNSDEKDNQDETIVTSDLYNITDDELYNIIKTKLKSKALFFAIFDSCHSGTVLDLRYTLSEIRGKLNIVEDEDKVENNIITISGCLDNQYSEETITENGVGGLMTWAFLKVLKENKDLSWKDLYLNIKKILKEIRADQVSLLSMGILINLNNKVGF